MRALWCAIFFVGIVVLLVGVGSFVLLQAGLFGVRHNGQEVSVEPSFLLMFWLPLVAIGTFLLLVGCWGIGRKKRETCALRM